MSPKKLFQLTILAACGCETGGYCIFDEWPAPTAVITTCGLPAGAEISGSDACESADFECYRCSDGGRLPCDGSKKCNGWVFNTWGVGTCNLTLRSGDLEIKRSVELRATTIDYNCHQSQTRMENGLHELTLGPSCGDLLTEGAGGAGGGS
jgi:hypothetical protein